MKLNLSDPEHLVELFDKTPFGLVFTDENHNFIKVNAAFCRIVGYTQAELYKKTWEDITHPEDLKIDEGMAQDVINEQLNHFEMNKRYIHKMGGAIWCRVTVQIIWKENNGKAIDYAVGFVMPLINGERLKAEYNSRNQVTIRPSVHLFEFWKDNWKTLIPITLVIVGGIIGSYARVEDINDKQGKAIIALETKMEHIGDSLEEIKSLIKGGD